MANTENYNLYITDDTTELFSDWRDEMNGETDSNMTKIDEALSNKADNNSITMTLDADNWGSSTPPTQTLTITGLTPTTNGVISVSPSATAEERDAARNALLSISLQGSNTLVIVADREVPEIDIPVTLIIFG